MNDRSTFALRFEFARARQHALGTWREDQVLAEHIGVAPSRIAEYKTRDEAPAAGRTLMIAEWCGVDPGWLAFGEASGAPRPDGFALWLENRRKTVPQLVVAESAAPPKSGLQRSPTTRQNVTPGAKAKPTKKKASGDR